MFAMHLRRFLAGALVGAVAALPTVAHAKFDPLVLLNAGAAIYVAGRADSIAAGVSAAAESIDSGAARRVLEHYVSLSMELSAA